jgi:hypothetical protein
MLPVRGNIVLDGLLANVPLSLVGLTRRGGFIYFEGLVPDTRRIKDGGWDV